jgi:hypothetical protein
MYIQGVPGGMCQTSGGVFLMVKYTDITQNTHVQSWTVTEIMAREKCGLLAGPCTVAISWHALSMFVLECGMVLCHCLPVMYHVLVLGNPKDNYDTSASFFVAQFNGFMSLTS